MTYPLPPNETERLAELRRYTILDTPPDPAFDRITRLAARIFSVPIALVSLVDDHRQWFKSAYGMSIKETPRELSLCSYTILANDVLVVPDALNDLRLAPSPLVTGAPNIRFYAGAPLVTPDGYHLGTLCIMDSVPRTLNVTQRATLADLAALVVDELQLHLANCRMRDEICKRQEIEAALAKSEAQYRLLFESNPEAMWVYDQVSLRLLGANDATVARYGYSHDELLSLSMHDIQPVEAYDEADPRFVADRRDGRLNGVWLHRTKQCGTLWADVVSYPIDFSGRPAMLVLAKDITEQRSAADALRASEERLAGIISSAMDAIILIGSDGQIVVFNAAAERMFRCSATTAIGQTIDQFVPEVAHEQSWLFDETRTINRRLNAVGTLMALRSDGEAFPIEATISQTTSAGASLSTIIIRDITERTSAEMVLRANEAKLQMIAAQMPSISWTCDTQLRITSSQGAGLEQLDREYQRFVNSSLYDLFGTDVPYTAPVAAHLQALAGDSAGYEINIGSRIYAVQVEPLRDRDQQIIGCISLAIDITERKAAEAALYESNARLQAIFNSEPECVKIVGIDGVLLEMNPAGLAMIEADAATQVVGQPVIRLIHAEDRALFQTLHQAVSEGHSGTLQFRVLGLRGGVHWMESSSVPLRNQAGTITAILSVTREITQRKQAEYALHTAYAQLSMLSEELRRSRDLLRTLFDGLDDGMVLLDSAGCILAINQAFASLLGHQLVDLIDQPWASLCTRDEDPFPVKLVLQTLFDGRARRRRERYTTPQGEARILDLQTLPLFSPEKLVDQVIVHIADVTERIQIEALVMQNELLAANGRLAATMAHEINTPLQSIRTCLYLAGKTAEERRDDYFELAREEIDRISTILRHLLDLHRPGNGSPASLDLNQLIERVLLLAGGALADHSIEALRELDPHLPLLKGHADGLMQVLLNLTMNAVDAMPDGGTLRFHSYTDRAAEADGPPLIVVEIHDTGCGISPETQPHIFEPFFTTKSHGSGIGLAIVQKMIQQHDGQVFVHSELGKGSRFKIVLPSAALNMSDRVDVL